jgi:hypothetical protein
MRAAKSDDDTSPSAHIPYEITPTACPLQSRRKSCVTAGRFGLSVPTLRRRHSGPRTAAPYVPRSHLYQTLRRTAITLSKQPAPPSCMGASLLPNTPSCRKYRVPGHGLAFPLSLISLPCRSCAIGDKTGPPARHSWELRSKCSITSAHVTCEGRIRHPPATRLFLPHRTGTFLLSTKSRRSPPAPGSTRNSLVMSMGTVAERRTDAGTSARSSMSASHCGYDLPCM